MVKNPPATARDTRDVGSIPGPGRSLGEGTGNPLQYSCLEIPGTEGPDGLQPMGWKSVGRNLGTKQESGVRGGKQDGSAFGPRFFLKPLLDPFFFFSHFFLFYTNNYIHHHLPPLNKIVIFTFYPTEDQTIEKSNGVRIITISST